MRQDIKQAWIRALRSGKYQQGQYFLKTYDGYCCLGVLAKVLHQQFPEILVQTGVEFQESNDQLILVDDKQHKGTLPYSLRDHTDINLFLSTSTLLSMNDLERISFDEIADWINSNL